MAYTRIHAITKTLKNAINYGVEDKPKLLNDDVNSTLVYIEKDKDNNSKLYKTKTSTIGCSKAKASEAFAYIRNIHEGRKNDKHKDNGDENIAWHCIQTFAENLDAETANEIGKKLAEECFAGHQCVISTHTNTEYTHNHIIFNAWAIADGKKYNDCNETKRVIRKVSDRLCEEYGLNHMPETRDMKTVKWVDAKGKTRVYEPTKRKERIRQGKYSDANDYRNTEAYIQSENYKKTNRETIKSDIDKLLPEAKSYEDLLFLLRRNGYIIKDKKVNGDWLKYITYKTASQESGTRDYKLGEDYTRENLTARIKNKIRDIIAGYEMNLQKNTDTVFNTVLIKPEQIQSDQARSESNESDKIPYNIDEINDKYRIINDKNKGITFEKIPRGEVEQYIINDVKKLHDNIQQIYDNQKDTLQPEKPEPVLNNRRSQYYLDRINANLKTLKFVEEKHIHSFEQINSVVTALYEKKKQAQSELTKIKNTLEKAGETVIAINTMNQIKDRIKKQQQTNGYKKEEIDAEGEFLKNYEDNLRKQNLGEREKQEKFVLNYNRFHASYEKLAESLTAVNEQIREYDDCVRTLNYIDKENSKKYTAEVQEYYDIKTRQERD